MGGRLAAVVLAAMMLAGTVSCGRIDRWWRSQRDVVTVRWPATSPADEQLDFARGRGAGDKPDLPLPLPTQLADGVRVREGTLHDIYYLEVILGDADFDDTLPLVVLLHGRGDRPRIPGGPFGGVPTPMRLIIPRGPLRLGSGYAWFLTSVTQGRPDVLAESLRIRTHHLAAFIATLSEKLPTSGRPIVSGFSQGGMLAFSLAVLRPDAVGQAFPLAGWLPPALMPTAAPEVELRVPIRSLHGTRDPVIPIAPTREVVAMLRALDWPIELIEFDGVGHVVSPQMNAMFEGWLEDALQAQAPALSGQGLGMPGPEDDMYDPFEPLDDETIKAIEELEGQTPQPDEPVDVPPSGDDATEPPSNSPVEPSPGPPEGRTGAPAGS